MQGVGTELVSLASVEQSIMNVAAQPAQGCGSNESLDLNAAAEQLVLVSRAYFGVVALLGQQEGKLTITPKKQKSQTGLISKSKSLIRESLGGGGSTRKDEYRERLLIEQERGQQAAQRRLEWIARAMAAAGTSEARQLLCLRLLAGGGKASLEQLKIDCDYLRGAWFRASSSTPEEEQEQPPAMLIRLACLAVHRFPASCAELLKLAGYVVACCGQHAEHNTLSRSAISAASSSLVVAMKESSQGDNIWCCQAELLCSIVRHCGEALSKAEGTTPANLITTAEIIVRIATIATASPSLNQKEATDFATWASDALRILQKFLPETPDEEFLCGSPGWLLALFTNSSKESDEARRQRSLELFLMERTMQASQRILQAQLCDALDRIAALEEELQKARSEKKKVVHKRTHSHHQGDMPKPM